MHPKQPFIVAIGSSRWQPCLRPRNSLADTAPWTTLAFHSQFHKLLLEKPFADL